MHARPALHRCARRAWRAWVLALLVLATLAPGLSRALAATRAAEAPWGIVCTAPGSVGDESPDGAAHALFDHCPLCLWHADLPALPPGTAQHRLPPPPLPLWPGLFLWAPRPLPAWAAARPRGPPASV